MSEYKALSVSVSYSQAEDRIQWISRCEGDVYIRAWITRRFLDLLMPRIADWMMKGNDRSNAASGTFPVLDSVNNAAISVYEHQLARQQVEAVRESIPVMKIIDEFLVDNFTMGMTKKGSISLVIGAPKDRARIRFQATRPQVHRIVDELMRVGNASGWRIPDPWKTLEQEKDILSAMIIN